MPCEIIWRKTKNIDQMLHIIQHQTTILEKYNKRMLSMFGNVFNKVDNLRASLFESQTLSYIHEIYKNLNSTIDSQRLPLSLVEAESLTEYFTDFRNRIFDKGYSLIDSFDDIFFMKCQMVHTEDGLLSFNFIMKAVNEDSI